MAVTADVAGGFVDEPPSFCMDDDEEDVNEDDEDFSELF